MMTDKESWEVFRALVPSFISDLEINAFYILSHIEPPVKMEEVWKHCKDRRIIVFLMQILNEMDLKHG